MNPLPLQPPGDPLRYIQSLGLSLLMHGLAIGAGVMLLGDLHLAPQSEPFTWEVSVVEAPVSKQGEVPGSSPTPPAPSPTKTQSVEPQRATRPIQMVQPAQSDMHQEVRNEISDVTPAVQASEQPPQMISRAMQPTDAPQPMSSAAATEAVPPTSSQTVAQPAEPITATEVAESAAQQAIASTVPPAPDQSVISRQDGEVPQSQPIDRTRPETTEATTQAATPVIQEAAVRGHPGQPSPAAKPDYGWLAQTLVSRTKQLLRYPPVAKMNDWEGRVVLRFVIKEDGQLVDIKVVKSSGHSVLDLNALEVVRQMSPLKLIHPLGKPRVPFELPISYSMLDR